MNRTIGIDYGRARVGLAVSDPLGIFASPLETVPAAKIIDYLQKYAAGGETIETTATYTITETDVLAGSFTNTVTAKMGNITKTAEATVNTEEPNPSLKVEKTTRAKDLKRATHLAIRSATRSR